MRVAVAIMTAILFVIMFYIGMIITNKLFNLEMKIDKYVIKDKVFIALLVFSTVITGTISYWRFTGMPIPMIILTGILLIYMPVLTMADIKKQIIPNKILLGLLVIWITIVCIFVLIDITEAINILIGSLTGAFVAGATFLLCYILSKKQVGAGDVKLVFIMGLYMTGDRIIGAILYGSIICCVYSIIQMVRKKLSLKSGVPMVPFLYLGTVVTFLIL